MSSSSPSSSFTLYRDTLYLGHLCNHWNKHVFSGPPYPLDTISFSSHSDWSIMYYLLKVFHSITRAIQWSFYGFTHFLPLYEIIIIVLTNVWNLNNQDTFCCWIIFQWIIHMCFMETIFSNITNHVLHAIFRMYIRMLTKYILHHAKSMLYTSSRNHHNEYALVSTQYLVISH